MTGEEERIAKGEPPVGEVVEAVRAYMLTHPQLRLGQILSNMSVANQGGQDPYYMTDRNLVDHLRAALEEGAKNG